jgi:hypothetical protein
MGFAAPSQRLAGGLVNFFSFVDVDRVASNDKPDGVIGKEPLEHIEADVPARYAHRYETTIDVVLQGKARAASPSH